jgi:hypothetical protein
MHTGVLARRTIRCLTHRTAQFRRSLRLRSQGRRMADRSSLALVRDRVARGNLNPLASLLPTVAYRHVAC